MGVGTRDTTTTTIIKETTIRVTTLISSRERGEATKEGATKIITTKATEDRIMTLPLEVTGEVEEAEATETREGTAEGSLEEITEDETHQGLKD